MGGPGKACLKESALASPADVADGLAVRQGGRIVLLRNLIQGSGSIIMGSSVPYQKKRTPPVVVDIAKDRTGSWSKVLIKPR
jgi:hypothetical protein